MTHKVATHPTTIDRNLKDRVDRALEDFSPGPLPEERSNRSFDTLATILGGLRRTTHACLTIIDADRGPASSNAYGTVALNVLGDVYSAISPGNYHQPPTDEQREAAGERALDTLSRLVKTPFAEPALAAIVGLFDNGHAPRTIRYGALRIIRELTGDRSHQALEPAHVQAFAIRALADTTHPELNAIVVRATDPDRPLEVIRAAGITVVKNKLLSRSEKQVIGRALRKALVSHNPPTVVQNPDLVVSQAKKSLNWALSRRHNFDIRPEVVAAALEGCFEGPESRSVRSELNPDALVETLEIVVRPTELNTLLEKLSGVNDQCGLSESIGAAL